MAYQTLRFETDGPLGVLTLNRPERLNALSRGLIADLTHLVGELEVNPHVRVIIVTGEGRAFCAGADIKERAESPDDFALQRTSAQLSPTFRRLEKLPQVTIAAINGPAAGGGLELAMACDLRIAASSATMALPEINLGILPGAGGTQRLPRLIGAARAKELMLTARFIDAATAHTWGLVNAVAEPAALMDEARALAGVILDKPPLSVAHIKMAANVAGETDIDSGIDFEQRCSTVLAMSEDRREGQRAFVEKRKPVFIGR
jgi:enoyl-CoA hydratase